MFFYTKGKLCSKVKIIFLLSNPILWRSIMKRSNSNTNTQNLDSQKFNVEFDSLFDSNSLTMKQRSDLRRNLTEKRKK